MFKTYLKIALRRLIKYKKFSVINILGLAIGLACFLMILLWAKDELSYDKFHKNADNIYMVVRQELKQKSAVTSLVLGPALRDELPEVVDSTAYCNLPDSFKSYFKNGDFGAEENVGLTDSRFFSVFSFPLIKGDPGSVFQDPMSVVMTERMARKYFGDADPTGKSLEMTFLGRTFSLHVTGILKNLPSNSHLQREILQPVEFIRSFGIKWDNWYNQTVTNYILTNGAVDTVALSEKIRECKMQHYEEANIDYSLIPLEQLHLHTSDIGFFSTTGDIRYVYFFCVIAGFILLIACMNYANLSNALSLKRTREIGIQKVVGAQRSHLIWQHFGETFLLTFLAMVLALLIVEFAMPVLNQLVGKQLSLDYSSTRLWTILLLLVLGTGILSSLLPAWFISGFQLLPMLRGTLNRNSAQMNFSSCFVIVQFAASIVIIVSTIVVYHQLKYVQYSDLGYDQENIVCVKLRESISSQYDAFRQELLKNPSILSVCRSEPLNAKGMGKTSDLRWSGLGAERLSTWVLHVDDQFAPTYGIEMLEGRFYDEATYPTDATQAFVVNERAMKVMGFESIAGETISMWGRTGTVIGVAKDFHFASFHHEIEPLVFYIPKTAERQDRLRELSVRVAPNSIPQALNYIKKTWRSFGPGEPFNYYLFDDSLNESYQAEQRMGVLFRGFAMLAIFIACLGLYGLIALTIEQKVKEIGIYKTLGAGIGDITIRLTKRYLRMVIIANLVAWPAAYYFMHRWLEDFPYRVQISAWPFLLTGLAVLLIASLTISWQAIRAATANPVESLRYE